MNGILCLRLYISIQAPLLTVSQFPHIKENRHNHNQQLSPGLCTVSRPIYLPTYILENEVTPHKSVAFLFASA